MKVKLKNIVPNPFRSEIGGFSDSQISSIIESCEMSGYGKYCQFDVREVKGKKGKYELVYGHHRLKAFEKFYGKDHEASIVIKDYHDDQMFTEMCRENLTKENDVITRSGIFMATKKMLEQTANQVDSSKKTHKFEVGTRQIADFLSKNGSTVSHETVRRHLSIVEGLAPDLKAKVGRTNKISGEEVGGMLPIKIATGISDLGHKEQKDVVKALNNSSEQVVSEYAKIICRYKNASDTEKKAIREGKMDIALVGAGADGIVSKEGVKKYNVDRVLGQIENHLINATKLLTFSVCADIEFASKGKRSDFVSAVNRFIQRLNEVTDETDANTRAKLNVSTK